MNIVKQITQTASLLTTILKLLTTFTQTTANSRMERKWYLKGNTGVCPTTTHTQNRRTRQHSLKEVLKSRGLR